MTPNPRTDGPGGRSGTVATLLLRFLDAYGIEYVFANFGTEHSPILEAAAAIRSHDEWPVPSFITYPHESTALSATHTYAAVTGKLQAVFVHVDVGTQNLGPMIPRTPTATPRRLTL